MRVQSCMWGCSCWCSSGDCGSVSVLLYAGAEGIWVVGMVVRRWVVSSFSIGAWRVGIVSSKAVGLYVGLWLTGVRGGGERSREPLPLFYRINGGNLLIGQALIKIPHLCMDGSRAVIAQPSAGLLARLTGELRRALILSTIHTILRRVARARKARLLVEILSYPPLLEGGRELTAAPSLPTTIF